MTKKDILELKRRLKKTGVTFSKMCGCYVSSNKEVLLNIDEMFLNLEDDEFDKYLDIAKKTLSGTLGNNLLKLDFPLEEEFTGGKQHFLMELRDSKLKDGELLDKFYQNIIDSYDYPGNYLILLFHDLYDVIKKTTDKFSLDESEEVYEYLICAICPVELTKAGLGYLENENRIGPRNRDWVVSPPDTGFIFPAFTDRSTDIHSTLFYTKKPLEPHREIIESVLGCPSKATAAEQKKTFQTIVKKAVNDSEEEKRVFGDIQESFSLLIGEQAELSDSSEEPIILTNESIREILTENSLPEELSEKIGMAYEENFADELPVVDFLLDKKVLAENDKRKVEKALMEKVEILEVQLEEAKNYTAASLSASSDEIEEVDSSKHDVINGDSKNSNYDVVLHVKPKKIEQITYQYINGKKHIVVPIDEDEQVNVNGRKDLM